MFVLSRDPNTGELRFNETPSHKLPKTPDNNIVHGPILQLKTPRYHYTIDQWYERFKPIIDSIVYEFEEKIMSLSSKNCKVSINIKLFREMLIQQLYNTSYNKEKKYNRLINYV